MCHILNFGTRKKKKNIYTHFEGCKLEAGNALLALLQKPIVKSNPVMFLLLLKSV